jgi:asparagine synthase (glutamine-hydrolysing)
VCGIAGHLSVAARADTDAVRRMAAALSHRGPDAEGIFSWGRAALGHRRLSIIDLRPEANQPLLNEDETIGIVCNGEIYNHAELREHLAARGHVFRSRSDNEVVLHLYEEYGPTCVTKLRGMFAYAIWDSRAERLVLARDRAGKKPLFYRVLPDGGVAFASEVHALLRGFADLPATPNLSAIDEYLTLQYVPSPYTAYEEIAKLSAAHVAVIEPGKPIAIERYWTKPRGPELRGSEEDVARELRAALEAAVRRRLVADVPLGAFLSGGIDSSAIVGLMATASTRPVKTFSIGFPDASDSELPWARMVARRYGTDHHEEIVHADLSEILRETISHHGEPFGDSSAVATYCLARLSRRHVTVALSGDASDETFAGYTRYATARVAHLHEALPAALRRPYRALCNAVARVGAPHMVGWVNGFEDDEAARYPFIMCQFTDAEKKSLYRTEMRAAMTSATVERFRRVLSETSRRSPIAKLIELDWHTYLIDDINVKVDIASMAHALEVRCPFLDTDVVELAARIPSPMLMRVRGKRILRRAVRDLVPAPILRRRKRGFGLPLRRMMQRPELSALVRDTLLDRTARERGLFDPKEVSRLVGAIDREHNAADRVWTLLVLELWFRDLVDRRETS